MSMHTCCGILFFCIEWFDSKFKTEIQNSFEKKFEKKGKEKK